MEGRNSPSVSLLVISKERMRGEEMIAWRPKEVRHSINVEEEWSLGFASAPKIA